MKKSSLIMYYFLSIFTHHAYMNAMEIARATNQSAQTYLNNQQTVLPGEVSDTILTFHSDRFTQFPENSTLQTAVPDTILTFPLHQEEVLSIGSDNHDSMARLAQSIKEAVDGGRQQILEQGITTMAQIQTVLIPLQKGLQEMRDGQKRQRKLNYIGIGGGLSLFFANLVLQRYQQSTP